MYQKLGLNGLVVLGCFKRFLLGQSPPYEPFYQGLKGVSNFVGWFCQNQDFSFWGRKWQETQKLRVLTRILRKNPDIPGFAELWTSGCLGQWCVYTVQACFKVTNHNRISHIICIRVAAATKGVVYKMVAEPHEPLEQAQQAERREDPAQGPVHHSTEQQPEGKPRCTS